MKVLGFDSWTVGAHHFERLVQAFAARGMTVQLVHLGSWGNDIARQPIETIGCLSVRDICSYRNSSLEYVLDEEKPDAVILLSTMTFAHRAFIRYCKARGIPTLNLYHGMTTTWFDVEAKVGIRASSLGHTRFVIKKLIKTFRHTIPCYVSALLRTKASRADWQRFWQDLVNMLSGQHIAIASIDARTDICAVYTESEVDHAKYTYGFARKMIHVVGNPDLGRFGLQPESIGCNLQVVESPSRRVMYIDTGLAPAGLIFSSLAEFVAHVRVTNKALAEQGWEMLLKLHPAHDFEAIKANLDGSGVKLVSNHEFIDRLRECDASIVETTTLAMIPALLGVPMFFAKYGVLRDLSYGSALTSYPKSDYLLEITSFNDQLSVLQAHDLSDDVKRWAALNSGPLPAALMPDRVAECILSLLALSRHQQTLRPKSETPS